MSTPNFSMTVADASSIVNACDQYYKDREARVHARREELVLHCLNELQNGFFYRLKRKIFKLPEPTRFDAITKLRKTYHGNSKVSVWNSAYDGESDKDDIAESLYMLAALHNKLTDSPITLYDSHLLFYLFYAAFDRRN